MSLRKPTQRKSRNTNAKEEDSSLKYRSGSTATELDKALKRHKTDVQSFYGQSFTGNHCNKCLKDSVWFQTSALTPVRTSQKLVDNPEIHLKAHITQQIFDELNECFSAAYEHISHDLPDPSASVLQTEQTVESYMNFFRRNLPVVKIFPKQHILEKHCIDQISTWAVGLSMMGEQEGKQLRSRISALKQQARAIKKEDKQLQFIMRQHHPQVSPALGQYMATCYARQNKDV